MGVVDGEPMIDLCYDEDVRAEVDLNVVMNRQGHFVELQGTAEHRPFSRATLQQLLDLAAGGVGELLRSQAGALGEKIVIGS